MRSSVKTVQVLVRGLNKPHTWSTAFSLRHYPLMQNSLQCCVAFLSIERYASQR